MKKKLLIFAHRGEARSFFSHYSLKALPFLEGLYECPEHFLLLTGEGPWKAGPKLALVLGQYSMQIDQVINLGIAGALRDSLELKKVYPIRTCFLEQNNDLQFSSHSLSNQGLDLITCHTRVLNSELADHLDSFAPIVDRELWSLGQVCSLAKFPLRAYKLISDRVGETEICQRVKEESDELSQILFDHYHTLSPVFNDHKQATEEGWEGFYFTTSLRNQREALLQKMMIKLGSRDLALKQLNLKAILEIEEIPKKKAIILIDKMKSFLNPVQIEVQNSLQELSSKMIQAGAMVKFPKNFEKAAFHLSVHIEKAEDLAALIKAMEEFNYPKLVDLIQGADLNV